MPETTGLVAFVEALTVADVPVGLPLAPGVTVTDPASMLDDLRAHLNNSGLYFARGILRAEQLRDALADRP